MNKEELNKKTVKELKIIARELNLSKYSRLKKAELIDKIIESQGGELPYKTNGTHFTNLIIRSSPYFIAVILLVFFIPTIRVWVGDYSLVTRLGVSFVFLVLVILMVYYKTLEQRSKTHLLAILFIGFLTIQAGWPLFAPKIEVEPYENVLGVVDGSLSTTYMYQNVKITVYPPLIPFFVSNKYLIAENLDNVVELTYDPRISISKASGTEIKIELHGVSGWDWYKLSKNIKYSSRQKIMDVKFWETEIRGVQRSDRLDSFKNTFPYDYRVIGPMLSNNADYRVRFKLNLTLKNGSEAWIKLDEWIGEDGCPTVIRGEERDYTKAYIGLNILYPNGTRETKITKEALKQPYLIIPYSVTLQPHEGFYEERNVLFMMWGCL
jgi:hypothetical protein